MNFLNQIGYNCFFILATNTIRYMHVDHIRNGEQMTLLHENGIGYTLTAMETDKPGEGRMPLLRKMVTLKKEVIDIEQAFSSSFRGIVVFYIKSITLSEISIENSPTNHAGVT